MSETLAHTRLVGAIVAWIRLKHASTPGLCLFCDCPTILQTEKPSPIEGYFPDVYAVTAPSTLTILGEAKTVPDLESERSYRQFLAFFRFLEARPQPLLVLATPWQAVATARCVLSQAKRETQSTTVAFRFLTDQDVPC